MSFHDTRDGPVSVIIVSVFALIVWTQMSTIFAIDQHHWYLDIPHHNSSTTAIAQQICCAPWRPQVFVSTRHWIDTPLGRHPMHRHAVCSTPDVGSSVCRCNSHNHILSIQRHVYSSACRLNGVSTHWDVDPTACRCMVCRSGCRYIGCRTNDLSLQRLVEPKSCTAPDTIGIH